MRRKFGRKPCNLINTLLDGSEKSSLVQQLSKTLPHFTLMQLRHGQPCTNLSYHISTFSNYMESNIGFMTGMKALKWSVQCVRSDLFGEFGTNHAFELAPFRFSLSTLICPSSDPISHKRVAVIPASDCEIESGSTSRPGLWLWMALY